MASVTASRVVCRVHVELNGAVLLLLSDCLHGWDCFWPSVWPRSYFLKQQCTSEGTNNGSQLLHICFLKCTEKSSQNSFGKPIYILKANLTQIILKRYFTCKLKWFPSCMEQKRRCFELLLSIHWRHIVTSVPWAKDQTHTHTHTHTHI